MKQQKHRQGLYLADGWVSEIIDATHRVRVEVRDQGIVTKPLPVFSPCSKGRTAYDIPAIGTHVKVLMDSQGNEGIVLTSLYDTADPPPVQNRSLVHRQFPGGELFQFDESTGTLTINCNKIVIDCDDKVEITSANPSILQGKEITVVGGIDSAGHPIVTSGQ